MAVNGALGWAREMEECESSSGDGGVDLAFHGEVVVRVHVYSRISDLIDVSEELRSRAKDVWTNVPARRAVANLLIAYLVEIAESSDADDVVVVLTEQGLVVVDRPDAANP